MDTVQASVPGSIAVRRRQGGHLVFQSVENDRFKSRLPGYGYPKRNFDSLSAMPQRFTRRVTQRRN